MSNQSPGLWPDTDIISPQDEIGDNGNPNGLSVSDAQDASNDSLTKDETVPMEKKAASKRTSKPDASQTEASAPIGEKKSKSARIREYLDANPEARNRDIATALEAFGVKAADVANVKAQLKQKAASVGSVATLEVVDGNPGKATKTKKKAGRKPTKTSKKAAATRDEVGTTAVANGRSAATADIGLAEVDAGISFIEQVGGVARARQIIDLVDRIRQLNLG